MKYTEYENYDNDKEKKDSAEFCEVDKVCIGCPKPCITEILEGFVKVEVKDTKIVKNCDGFKLTVEGCKYIKIVYCSNDKCACHKTFTETFVVPFKHTINYCGCHRDLCDIDVYVDECNMKKISNRCVIVKTRIVVDPELECHEYEYWDDDWDCKCEIESCCKKSSDKKSCGKKC